MSLKGIEGLFCLGFRVLQTIQMCIFSTAEVLTMLCTQSFSQWCTHRPEVFQTEIKKCQQGIIGGKACPNKKKMPKEVFVCISQTS